jgi:hypothetical protein
MTWTNLSAGGGNVQGAPPAARGGLGLAYVEGGLYVFGGWDDSGKCRQSTWSTVYAHVDPNFSVSLPPFEYCVGAACKSISFHTDIRTFIISTEVSCWQVA